MNKPIAAALVALVAVAATACTSVSGQSNNTTPTGANHASSAASAPASTSTAASEPTGTSESTADASASSDTAAFGQTFTWDDGLSITVGKPTAYKPGEYAAYDKKFKSFVVMSVRVVNKTGKAWDPSLISATIQSGDAEGDRVFDSGQLPDEPSTKVLNGREVNFKIAFGVQNPKDLVLEIAPDWGHDSAIFSSGS